MCARTNKEAALRLIGAEDSIMCFLENAVWFHAFSYRFVDSVNINGITQSLRVNNESLWSESLHEKINAFNKYLQKDPPSLLLNRDSCCKLNCTIAAEV